jgi:hypothetical protein
MMINYCMISCKFHVPYLRLKELAYCKKGSRISGGYSKLNSAMFIGPTLPVVSFVAFLTVLQSLKMDSVDPTFDAEAQRGDGPEVQRSGT